MRVRSLFGLLLIVLAFSAVPRIAGAQSTCGWARTIPPPRAMVRDTAGFLTLTGSLTHRHQPGGQTYWLMPPGGVATQVTPSGHTLVAGTFNDSLYLTTSWVQGRPGTNLFVAQFDGNGLPVWHFTAGGVDTTGNSPGYAATGLRWDAHSGLWVVGGYFRDTLVWGTDTLKAFGGTDTTATQATDGFIGWMAPDGTPIRAVRFGGRKNDRAHALALGPEGYIYLTGRFADTAFFGTNPGDTLRAFAYQNPVPGFVFEDAFVACYDTLGTFRWARRAGASIYNICPGDVGLTAQADQRGVYIGGTLQTAATVGDSTLPTGQSACTRLGFVASWDTAGVFRWNRWVGSPETGGHAAITTLAFDGQFGLMAGGFYNQNGIFNTDTVASIDSTRDAFILYLDVFSGWIGHTQYGGRGSDAIEAMVMTPQQTMYLAGTFTDTLPLPTGDTLVNGGLLPEGWLMGLANPGVFFDLPDSLSFPACGDSLWVHAPVLQGGPLVITPNNLGFRQYGEWLRIAPPLSGTYHLELQSSCPQTDSVYISVPTVNFGLDFTPRDTILYGDTLSFTANFVNLTPNASDLSFTWYFANYDSGTFNNPIYAETPPTMVYDTLGHYTVLLIAIHPLTGCSDTLLAPNTIILLPDTVIDDTTAFAEHLLLPGLALWPNPATHAARLEWAAQPFALVISATDAQGRTVWHTSAPAHCPGITLPVSDWPAGVYALNLHAPDGRLAVRRVVVR